MKSRIYVFSYGACIFVLDAHLLLTRVPLASASSRSCFSEARLSAAQLHTPAYGAM